MSTLVTAGTIHTSRASLRDAWNRAPATPEASVADLWSVHDGQWRSDLEQARQSTGPVVVLSSAGVEAADTPYLRILANREEAAWAAVPQATILRLAPIIEDLAVYQDSLDRGSTIFHAYGDQPVAWLSARDVVAMIARIAETPERQSAAYSIFGGEEITAEQLLRRWARILTRDANLVAVPAAILHQQLAPVLGDHATSAVIGHQQWVGSGLADPGPQVLERALSRAPTDIERALSDLAGSTS